MELLTALTSEHVLIDAAAGALRTWAARHGRGEAPAADGHGFLRFFRRWANDFHHAREEHVLFEALVKEASLPRDRGPIAAIERDHRELADALAELERLLGDGGGAAALEDVCVRYSRQLWHHIDAENTVLFPESEARLARHGVRELDGRAPTPDELAAKREGEALVARYPPLVDPEVFRGEGCVLCPAYGTRCEGLEREWWTESEWEEIHDRLTGM